MTQYRNIFLLVKKSCAVVKHKVKTGHNFDFEKYFETTKIEKPTIPREILNVLKKIPRLLILNETQENCAIFLII